MAFDVKNVNLITNGYFATVGLQNELFYGGLRKKYIQIFIERYLSVILAERKQTYYSLSIVHPITQQINGVTFRTIT